MTWELGKLPLKILEAEIDPERLRILQEELSCLGDLRGRLRLRECKTRNCARYPMSMPPLTFST